MSHMSQAADINIIFDNSQKKKMKDKIKNIHVCSWPYNMDLIKKNNKLGINNKVENYLHQFLA